MTATPEANKSDPPDRAAVREFYDRVYHRDIGHEAQIPLHYRCLANRFESRQGKQLLDVACGTGVWLRAAAALSAPPAGIDISCGARCLPTIFAGGRASLRPNGAVAVRGLAV